MQSSFNTAGSLNNTGSGKEEFRVSGYGGHIPIKDKADVATKFISTTGNDTLSTIDGSAPRYATFKKGAGVPGYQGHVPGLLCEPDGVGVASFRSPESGAMSRTGGSPLTDGRQDNWGTKKAPQEAGRGSHGLVAIQGYSGHIPHAKEMVGHTFGENNRKAREDFMANASGENLLDKHMWRRLSAPHMHGDSVSGLTPIPGYEGCMRGKQSEMGSTLVGMGWAKSNKVADKLYKKHHGQTIGRERPQSAPLGSARSGQASATPRSTGRQPEEKNSLKSASSRAGSQTERSQRSEGGLKMGTKSQGSLQSSKTTARSAVSGGGSSQGMSKGHSEGQLKSTMRSHGTQGTWNASARSRGGESRSGSLTARSQRSQQSGPKETQRTQTTHRTEGSGGQTERSHRSGTILSSQRTAPGQATPLNR